MALQNDFEYIADQLRIGNIDVDEANILRVEYAGFILVTKLPNSVRKTLMSAVKNGRLGHMAKNKEMHYPEVFFKPACRSRAIEARREASRSVIRALKNITC